MPIELITGLPGNAKTLYALQLLIDRASREQRPVYYSGLKEFLHQDPRLLGTTWVEFDAATWHETVPSGSLILIDEAQKIFRARSMTASPPKYVTELEEHRHRGVDFVMITQHPRLIDPAVRVLTQTHRHMVRVNGFERSTVHRWEAIKDTPEKPPSRKDSEKVQWPFAKDLYGLYKSADEHTIKRSIPGRVKLLGILAVLLAVMVWYFVSFIQKKTATADSPPTPAASAVAPVAQTGQSPAGGFHSEAMASPGPTVDPLADIEDYVFKETPRVTGLPHTAPKYDPITVPVRAPVPAMCVEIQRKEGRLDCRCYTQQATRMQDMEVNMCLDIVHNRRFQDFDADPGRRSHQQPVQQVAAVAEPPLERYSPGQVLSFPSVPDAPRVQGRQMK